LQALSLGEEVDALFVKKAAHETQVLLARHVRRIDGQGSKENLLGAAKGPVRAHEQRVVAHRRDVVGCDLEGRCEHALSVGVIVAQLRQQEAIVGQCLNVVGRDGQHFLKQLLRRLVRSLALRLDELVRITGYICMLLHCALM